MLLNLNLKIGDLITHSKLANLFEVKNLKTSRFIKEKNTLVLISNYTKGAQLNKWIGDTLHYTGGAKITNATNAKLADSRTNGVNIHLFQVMDPGVYTYAGLVKLVGDPYTDLQPNKDGVDQLVWVFPIQPEDADQVVKPPELTFLDLEDYKNRGKQAVYNYIRHRDNYIGYRVRHVEHGLGTVTSFDGSILTVTFDNNQTKSYHFQKSISGGFLRFLD